MSVMHDKQKILRKWNSTHWKRSGGTEHGIGTTGEEDVEEEKRGATAGRVPLATERGHDLGSLPPYS
jgi:hypothetical protein